MDWQEIDRDRHWLKRIVATLVALAWLADYAAALPGPVRWLGLWFLRRAETIARGLILGGDDADWPDLWEPDEARDEFTRLAASFRTLAAILGHMIRHADRRVPPGLRGAAGLAVLDAIAVAHPFGRATPPDTP